MKKFIAIAIVFALAAGAAFADSAISGAVEARAKLVDHQLGVDGYQPKSSGEFSEAYLQYSGTNDDGDFGALLRVKVLSSAHTHSIPAGTDAGGGNTGSGGVSLLHRTFVWWRPFGSDAFEIFLGQDPDGKFAPYNPWSFYKGQEGYHHVFNWRDYRRALAFTNWETFGLALTVKPIDNLEVNLVIPTGTTGGGAKDLRYIWGGGLQLTASYNIENVGKAMFGYKMPNGGSENDFMSNGGASVNMFEEGYEGRKGIMGFAFQLDGGVVDGLEVLVGGSFGLPGKADDIVPLSFALRLDYAFNDDFGIKTFWNLDMNTGIGYAGYFGQEGASRFEVNVQPYYNLGFLEAYFAVGFKSTKANKNADGVSAFFINPYVRKSLGSGYIRAGLLLEDRNMDVDGSLLSIPVTFGFSF